MAGTGHTHRRVAVSVQAVKNNQMDVGELGEAHGSTNLS
jgi:hypothetical protein